MAEEIIQLVDLTKKYGTFTAVDQLNLSIKKGEIFGLLGPNGAGKSTTILMMLGLTDPTSGSVTVNGINSTKNPIEVKRKVGYLPEDVGFYEEMSGMENLMFTARLNSLGEKVARERSVQVLERVGLLKEADKKTGKYSRGMRQRLGLADVLIKNPEIIILDEPTLGIDPKGVREFLDLIRRLSREEGLTVLLSSHHLHQVQEVCDRVGLFVQGKLIAEGNVDTLSRSLFANEPFLVEVRLAPNGKDETQVQEILQNVKGVTQVTHKDGEWQIGCSNDITAEIARVIVESGSGLIHLSKKEYGLNDIYIHYFQQAEEPKIDVKE